jgi:O-antigen ligase
MNSRAGSPGESTVAAAWRVDGLVANAGTIMLAAVLSMSLVFSVTFVDQVTSSRLLVLLIALLVWHVLVCPRIRLFRELYLYAGFAAYVMVASIWAPDFVLALNTLFPVLDFLLVMVLAASLVAYHDRRSVFFGLLAGLLAASAAYTYIVGFPLRIPEDFSYNAIASIYLYGLFSVLLYGCFSRSIAIPAVLATLMLLHIVVTTSIKTNLAVVLAAAVVTAFYFRQTAILARRYVLFLLVGLAMVAYLVLSTEGAVERLQYAGARMEVGIKVLQTREDQSGYGGFDERAYWLREGLNAWVRNPLFGAGVEAFRFRYGITSHSTVVDLLYNTGLLGFGLFYSMFASLLWRLLKAGQRVPKGVKATILAVLVSYAFVSLSGLVYYQFFLGLLVAASAVLLTSRDVAE